MPVTTLAAQFAHRANKAITAQAVVQLPGTIAEVASTAHTSLLRRQAVQLVSFAVAPTTTGQATVTTLRATMLPATLEAVALEVDLKLPTSLRE